eukprot:TRINITY_DN170_c0_g3_i1.p1 TRINITY_DN170_c0_g3~~TRINITY_DN170_c0_g3_i1.p1  ORF type:complete len:126 (+),score=17.24 TRINITY_DN170_c0_g3_i1:88-465(+)
MNKYITLLFLVSLCVTISKASSWDKENPNVCEFYDYEDCKNIYDQCKDANEDGCVCYSLIGACLTGRGCGPGSDLYRNYSVECSRYEDNRCSYYQCNVTASSSLLRPSSILLLVLITLSIFFTML